jgi:death-on-curing family protein
MRPKSVTVRDLAREAGTDLDDALVTLWEIGLEEILDATDVIRPQFVGRARAALRIVGRAELRSLRYWCAVLDSDSEAIGALLADCGIRIGPRARKIPPGGVSRLKAVARSRGINPLTGAVRQLTKTAGAAPRQGEAPAVDHSGQVVAREVPEPEFEDLPWSSVGHEPIRRWLASADILRIHFALVGDFDGTEDPIRPAGVRSDSLLESAASRPLTSLGEVLKYSTIECAAAALLHSLILDHPFHNGNKRTALVAALVFLDESGVVPTCDEDELFRLVLQIAQHRVVEPAPNNMADREVFAIAEWLRSRTRLVKKGESPLPWRRLRRQLVGFGCDLETPGSVGNRINISRRVERAGRFGRKTVRTLQTQVFYAGEGREADVSTIKKIRENLELDDMHGIDSLDFYSREPTSIGDFIARYRKTLRRLARL